MRKINLQLLAEPEAAAPEGTEQVEQPKGSEGQAEAKSYSQEEVDTLIASNKATWRKKELPPKDELDAFRAWQAEKKKSEPESKANDETRQQLAATQAELQQYKNREKVLKAGVAAQFADYAAFEVSKLLTDETDFDAELIKWLKANEHYKNAGTTGGSQGMRHGSSSGKSDGVEDAFYNLNPGLRPKI